MLKMRARAQEALGDRFNLRDFNELILENGAMPLGLLESIAEEWIQENGG